MDTNLFVHNNHSFYDSITYFNIHRFKKQGCIVGYVVTNTDKHTCFLVILIFPTFSSQFYRIDRLVEEELCVNRDATRMFLL